MPLGPRRHMKKMFFFILLNFFLPVSDSAQCHSQLCLDENDCSPLSTCEMVSGYCYNRIFYIPHGPRGSPVRGAESGCSTEFTSNVVGRCAGDLEDEEYTCVCSSDLCNEHFINGTIDYVDDDNFSLRRIECAEDDELKCNLRHQDRLPPCRIDHRTYCTLIKESASSTVPIRRHGRAGYWPMIEYPAIAVREVVCIQGMSMNHVIECYCKYDNCNDLRDDRKGKMVRLDQYYPLTRCFTERRFYASDDFFRWSLWNRSLEMGLDPIVTHTCLGHSCYTMYERELNVSRPWIRIQRGCMNYSRPWAFFDYVMDAKYGPRQRGMQICRQDVCNNAPLYQLLDEEFIFSGTPEKFRLTLLYFVCSLFLILWK